MSRTKALFKETAEAFDGKAKYWPQSKIIHHKTFGKDGICSPLVYQTWWFILLEGSSGDPALIGRLYVGYNISPSGSIIGFLSGCADGAIGGLAFGWLYNFIILKFMPSTS